MNAEKWLPVVGYEGFYEVSSLGRVRRVASAQGTRAGYLLAPIPQKRGGYLSVGLSVPGEKRKLLRVHRIVAEAFHGPSDLPLVRHIDGNPRNNVPENLAHGTPYENAQDRVLHGRSSMNNQNKGKTHCKRGHEFTPENTRIAVQTNGKQQRVCRICDREKSRRWEARRPKRVRRRA